MSLGPKTKTCSRIMWASLVMLVLLATLSPARTATAFTIVDLGTLGGSFGIAGAVSDRGQVVGAVAGSWGGQRPSPPDYVTVIEALRHGDRGQGPGDRRQTAPDGLNVDYPLLAPVALVWGDGAGRLVQGAGTTMVTGGTGAPAFDPVLTKFGFYWRDGQGRLECLALSPSAPAGSPGSGNFDTNVMYVTGEITSVEIRGAIATLKGLATVTGLGAGSNVPFTAVAERGGPGARFVLTVSGLTFEEILLEGRITF
jgi:hypothetical protein